MICEHNTMFGYDLVNVNIKYPYLVALSIKFISVNVVFIIYHRICIMLRIKCNAGWRHRSGLFRSSMEKSNFNGCPMHRIMV
jgi:hypothetical protein